MACEWGHDDCKFEGARCDLCFTDSQCYKPVAQKRFGLAKRAQKADGRQGSNFEYKNHKRNNQVLSDAVSGMTLNSGATVLEKGDEQILGSIRVMEELKTKTSMQAPGKKTFTMQKKWLDKLRREAKAEDMEFWYLKFSFQEADEDVYAVVEQDVLMSMVKTMVADRRKARDCDMRIGLVNKRRDALQADYVKALADISALKAELEYLKKSGEKDEFFAALERLDS